MNYFPLFADLTGRPVLVVGGGSVAARKVGLLLKAQGTHGGNAGYNLQEGRYAVGGMSVEDDDCG